MVIVPCTMGTLGRIAHGYSQDVLLRTADVMLKEKKQLILVLRETPYNLVHIRNMELLTLAGATMMPASPHFYHRPSSIEELVDTVVARILDHMNIDHSVSKRWKDEPE
jgi:4-hydroxy-3-polyprenylbenzoate decarboxylase